MLKFFEGLISQSDPMVKPIYEDFLDTPESYHACEDYWERLTTNLASAIGQAGEWYPWISRHYANGLPIELDMVPIWDGRSKRLDRGYRIIQHRPLKDDEIDFFAWLKQYEEEYNDLPRSELVINLSLSEESANMAMELLRKWMDPKTTIEEMKRVIEESVQPYSHEH